MVEFGYLDKYSKIPTTSNLGNISTELPTNNQLLRYNATSDLWEPISITPGDVVGPASNDTNAVTLFDGTSGKLLKSDPGLTYDPATNTLYTTNISRTGTGDLDIQASTTATTSSVNLTLPDDDSQGVLYIKSGDDTDNSWTGAEIKLETRPASTEAGRVVLSTGASTSALSDKNTLTVSGSTADIEFTTTHDADIYLETVAGTSSTTGYINLESGNATGSGVGGIFNLLAGSSGGSSNGGNISMTGGGGTVDSVTNQTGGYVLIEGGDITYNCGTADNGYITKASTGGYVKVNEAVSTTAGSIDMTLTAGNGYIRMSSATPSAPDKITFKAPDAAGVEPNGGYIETNILTEPLTINAGNGGTGTASGGAIIITGGTGTGAAGVGGAIEVTTGDAKNVGDSGSISIEAGAATNDDGGNVTVNGGAGTTTGGAINITTGTGAVAGDITCTAGTGTTDGTFTLSTAGVSYFWPNPSTLYSRSMMYVSDPATVTLSYGLSAEFVFKSGLLLKRWHNGLGSSGLTLSGNAQIIGTLGVDNESWLGLTRNITNQTGRVYFDVSGVTGYNSSYLRNWEFRTQIRSGANAGTSGGLVLWIYGQGNAHTSGNEGNTGGICIVLDENNGGNYLHKMVAYGARGSGTTLTSQFLGTSIGEAKQTSIRVRKQAQSVLVEIDRQGDNSSFASTSREFTIDAGLDETSGTYFGIGARNGPTASSKTFHQVSYIELRQLPDDAPVIRKF